MNKQLTIDEILKQLDIDSHSYHDGPWDYNGPTPSQKAKSAINKIVMEILNSGTIQYKKYDKCPACNERYMYACSCSDASDFVVEKQLKMAEQYGLGGKNETLA